jgi:hypothetical protein
MKRMNVARIIVIATLLVAFVATSAGTSFAATRSNPSQNYTPPVQSAAIIPHAGAVNTATFADDVNAAGNSLVGVGAVLAGVAALTGLVSSSSSGSPNPINSNVSPSAKSAFGR